MATKPEKPAGLGLGQRLRTRARLPIFLGAVVLLAVATAGGISGRYATDVLYENKLKDTWAILFLEMERATHVLESEVRAHGLDAAALAVRPPDAVWQFDGEKKLLPAHGLAKEEAIPSAVGFDMKTPQLAQVHRSPSGDWLLRQVTLPREAAPFGKKLEKGRYLFAWKVPVVGWLETLGRGTRYGRVYASTRRGTLLHATTPDVEPRTFTQRPLVQFFAAGSATEAQVELPEEDGKPLYGFFREVTGTNIVVFAEVKKEVALAPVSKIQTRFWVVLAWVLGITMLVITLPIRAISKPLRELIAMTTRVAKGDYTVTQLTSSFGELHQLAGSFVGMAQSLEKREQSIRELLVEKEEKARLQLEIEIAKGIQDSLLPRLPFPAESGVSVAARYMPAEECAGDWYTYHYSPNSKTAVLVIADVSGHGAGASMFTAITAELFEDLIESFPDDFPSSEFAIRLNKRMFKFGGGKWHTTLMVVKYRIGEDDAEILNAGHPSVLIGDPVGKSASFVRLASSPIGLRPEYEPLVQRIKLPPGSVGFLYTDGLIEQKMKNGRAFGRKRLLATVAGSLTLAPNGVVERVLSDWRKAVGKGKQEDDVCIIAFKRQAA